MERVQPGHEVLSLFGMTPKAQALSANPRQVAGSMVKATAIVAGVAIVLGTLTHVAITDVPTSTAVETTTVIEQASDEPVAFQAGQYVSSQLQAGYVGR